MKNDKSLSAQYLSKEISCNQEVVLHPALKDFFGYCLVKAAIYYRQNLDKRLASLKIVSVQFGILILLKRAGSISQMQIGKEMGIDKASMVKLIDALEKLGLVERNIHSVDRRVNLISLTGKGKSTLQKALKISQNVEKMFLSQISKTEAASMKKLMPQMVQSLLVKKSF